MTFPTASLSIQKHFLHTVSQNKSQICTIGRQNSSPKDLTSKKYIMGIAEILKNPHMYACLQSHIHPPYQAAIPSCPC